MKDVQQNQNTGKQGDLKKKAGDALERAGEKLTNAGLPGLGKKLYDTGDKMEHEDTKKSR